MIFYPSHLIFESFRHAFVGQMVTLQFYDECWKVVGQMIDGVEPIKKERFDALMNVATPIGKLSFYYHRPANAPRIKDIN